MIKDFNIQTLKMNESDGKGAKATKKTEANKPGLFARFTNWMKNVFKPKPKKEIKGSQNPLYNLYNPKGKSDENQAGITVVNGKTTTIESAQLESAQQTIASKIAIANHTRRQSSQPIPEEGFNHEMQEKKTEPVIKESGAVPPPPPLFGLGEMPKPGAWRTNKAEVTTTNTPSGEKRRVQSQRFIGPLTKEQTEERIQSSQEEANTRSKARIENEKKAAISEKKEKIDVDKASGEVVTGDDGTKLSFAQKINLLAGTKAEKFTKAESKTEQAVKDQENRRNSKIEIK